jgi:C4-type Zn-finger protein
MDKTLITSFVTALMGLLAAVLTEFFSRRLRKQRQAETAEVEHIAEAVKSEEATKRAMALEAAVRSIAQGQDSNKKIVESLEEISLRLASASDGSKQNAVEGLITGYHEQALSQAKAQFWFSVIAATTGFAWIIYSGSKIQIENLATAMGILPGVVMDTVAFLFFKQASATRERATELYDRLRKDKQATEAVTLVAAIEDPKVKSAVQAQLALHMAGLQPAAIDLTRFLEANEKA